MPAQRGLATLSTTGRYLLAVDKASGPGDNLGSLGIGVGASAWTCTGTVQGNPFTAAQDSSNLGWQNIQVFKLSNGVLESTPTLTANTAADWEFNAQPFQQVAFNVTAITGTMPMNIQTYFRQNGLNVTYGQSVSQAITGTLAITSASSSALAVGANGATNPVLQVDDSTSSQADGLKVTGAASGSGVALQGITAGTNAGMSIDAAAAGTITMAGAASTALGVQVGSSTSAANATLIVQSTNLKALVVGRLGATTPALQVDANTSTSITGVKIKAGATGTGVAVSAIGETNVALKVDASGSGVIALADTSTGPLYVGRGSLTAPQVAMGLTALGTAQSSAPTSAQLLGGLLSQTSATGAGVVTLPTGTALAAACARTPVTGDTFDCTLYNLGGGQTLTITGQTGTTVVGTAAVPSGKMATMKFYSSGSNTWNCYVIVSA